MSIPIIGQPSVGDWFFACVITCPCPAKTPMLFAGQPGHAVACPACQKVYQLGGMPGLTPQGQIALPLNVGQLTKEEKS